MVQRDITSFNYFLNSYSFVNGLVESSSGKLTLESISSSSVIVELLGYGKVDAGVPGQ